MHSSLAALTHNAMLIAASTAASTGKSSGGALTILPFLIIVGAIFYFLLYRPQRRRQMAMRSDARRTSEDLAPGVEIITRAGQYATVVSVLDDDIIVEIAPGVQSKFVRDAILRVVPPPGEELTPEDLTIEPADAPDPTDPTDPTHEPDGRVVEPLEAAHPAEPDAADPVDAGSLRVEPLDQPSDVTSDEPGRTPSDVAKGTMEPTADDAGDSPES